MRTRASRFAQWRKARIDELHEGTLPPEQEQHLDAVAPGWRPTSRGGPDAYRAWAEQLGSWMRAAGKIPDRDSGDAYERELGVWRRYLLNELCTGTLSPEREAYLDAVAPGWRPTLRGGTDVFRARAEDLGRWFAAADGRIPSRHSDLAGAFPA